MPMQPEDLEAYLQQSIPEYVEEHVQNGNWPAEGAMERSRNEILILIPDGLQTNHQYLFTIVEEGSHQKLGMLWVYMENEGAFVCDFRISEAQRGKGSGKQALTALGEKLKSMNVGLHIFGDNLTAQELYKKAVFKITGIHIKKILK